MTYEEATEFLFNSAPLFQNIGAGAYKEGLDGTLALDERFGHPHRSYPTIHVAGTNGKGSVSHTLAAILQSGGLRVGLYTSPHLLDFRERIRVNGEMIPEERVVRFVDETRDCIPLLHPSFFELATALAFKYFEEQCVDVAVIETGLGGRLDCTNVITPVLSVITNISYDHTQMLGDTLEKIAYEKAGIIKEGIPVVVGETVNDSVADVFRTKARWMGCAIVFADKTGEIISHSPSTLGGILYHTRTFGEFTGQLAGLCQEKNTSTILAAVKTLRLAGYNINNVDVWNGFAHVTDMTGLMGRWQVVCDSPLTICDTGHNEGGMQYIARQLEGIRKARLHIVFGMVSDKDVTKVLSLLPRNAAYYFTQASVRRAMPSVQLARLASEAGLEGQCYGSVAEAFSKARENASKDDIIFVGGSTFVVADMLKSIN